VGKEGEGRNGWGKKGKGGMGKGGVGREGGREEWGEGGREEWGEGGKEEWGKEGRKGWGGKGGASHLTFYGGVREEGLGTRPPTYSVTVYLSLLAIGDESVSSKEEREEMTTDPTDSARSLTSGIYGVQQALSWWLRCYEFNIRYLWGTASTFLVVRGYGLWSGT
jgi:hypothetical protein